MTRVYQIIYLIVVFCCINQVSVSQTRYGEELGDSILLIENSRNDFLYVGIDNVIKINYPKLEGSDEYILKVNNGEVIADSIYYISIPKRQGKARFLLYKKENSDSILVGYKYFVVRNVPDPSLAFDNFRVTKGDTVRKSDLLNSEYINIYISSDIINSENWFKIKEFTLGYEYGSYYYEHTNNTNRISYETKQVINTLGPTKEIVIKPIVEGEGGLIKELPIYRLILF
jgi:hypothetical protein